MFRSLKISYTNYLAKNFISLHNEYFVLYKEKTPEKLINFFEKMIKKRYPEYVSYLSNDFNKFSILLKKFHRGDLSEYEMHKELEKYPYFENVFSDCQYLIGFFGQEMATHQKAVRSLSFGVFFRDIPKNKRIPKNIRFLTKYYEKWFCKNWLGHIAFIYVNEEKFISN